MRLSVIFLIILLIVLGIKLYSKENGLIKARALDVEIKCQMQHIQNDIERNNNLRHHIEILKKYPVAIEEEARYALGMIKPGEDYFQVIEPVD